MYSKNKPKEGRWAHSTASKNIDSWVKDTSGGIVLSVHQLMIFLQAYSYAQLDMRKSFLQKFNLQQFFVDMDAHQEIESDLTTIKKCLKLMQDANSDTTKIAKQIDILEDVLIVKSMIKVSDHTFSLLPRIFVLLLLLLLLLRFSSRFVRSSARPFNLAAVPSITVFSFEIFRFDFEPPLDPVPLFIVARPFTPASVRSSARLSAAAVHSSGAVAGTNYMHHLLFAYLFIIICTIQVKKERAKSQWEVDSILTTAAAPIQELMNQPEVEAARKFVEVDLLMTCSIGDTQSKSLEDIKSLNVASYPVPGKNHKQVYHNLGWMKMDCNKTMWILLYAAVCAEHLTSAFPIGSTKKLFGLYSMWRCYQWFWIQTLPRVIRRKVDIHLSFKLYVKHLI